MRKPKLPHRLLIVDDEPVILRALRTFLGNLGFQVDTAAEKEEAEAMLATIQYAGVVADLRLLGSDSHEGLEIIGAARERSRQTRIVLLSAHGSAEIEGQARRAGADAVLRKPRPLPEIAHCLLDLLEGAA